MNYTVVHCTTFEEWEIVTNFYKYQWNVGLEEAFDINKEKSCINTERCKYSYHKYYEENGALIYSFEEWCKINNLNKIKTIKNKV